MFERDVSINGTTYTSHECTAIEHLLDRKTVVHSTSTGRSGEITRRHERDVDDGLTFSLAEEWMMGLEEFAEATDPAEEAARMAETAMREAEAATLAAEERLASVLRVLTDEQADSIIEMFSPWASGAKYTDGDRVRYNDTLWKCLQAHTSQDDWTPDVAVSLWVRVSPAEEDDDQETIAEWVQPTGSHDTYSSGDVVMHDGKVWQSTVDANVWEPSVYGWEEVAS